MKEIKAFIRQHRIGDVLQALHDSGFCDHCGGETGCHSITISQVQRPFSGENPSHLHFSMDLAEPVVAEYKLELICADDVADRLIEVIVKSAHPGQRGWVFLSDVQQAIQPG